MALRWHVMRRTLLLVGVGLLLTVALGLSHLQEEVDEELRAARETAQLAATLSVMDLMDDREALSRLATWMEGERLRNLALRVEDEQGRALMEASAGPEVHQDLVSRWFVPWAEFWLPTAPAERAPPVRWRVHRPDGRWWWVELRVSARLERHTGLHQMLTVLGLATLLGGALLWLLDRNIQRALAPMRQLRRSVEGLAAGDRSGLRRLPEVEVQELHALVTALRQLDRQLMLAEDDRRHMAHQIITLQEDERQRLAAELHDELGQHLTGLRVDLAWLEQQVARQPASLRAVQDMMRQLTQVHQIVRDMLKRLRPLHAMDPGLDVQEQLVQPLQALVRAWNRSAGMQTRFTLQLVATRADGQLADWLHCHPPRLPDELALVLYRISQEALTNAARHARATRVRLRLHWQAADDPSTGWLDWRVADDGVGIDDPDQARRRGGGLSGLHARVWSQRADLSCSALSHGQAGHVGYRGFCLHARFTVGDVSGDSPDPDTDFVDTLDTEDDSSVAGR